MARNREQTRERIKELLEEQGRSCPNETCLDYGKRKTDTVNLVKNSHTDGGRQRYLCKSCGKTFTATKGTPFYQLHTDWVDVLEVLAGVPSPRGLHLRRWLKLKKPRWRQSFVG